MATTRLRKAFRYPDDSDSEPAEGIDEEEQEKLITELQTEDVARTTFYKRAFLALPALSLVLYLRPLLAPTSFSEFLTAALSITSLAASAYHLYLVPLGSASARGPSKFFPAPGGSGASTARKGAALDAKKIMGLLGAGSGGVDDGPVERFLPLLNAALCGVVWLGSWAARTKVDGWEGVLPALVLVLVFLVRSQLAPVDVAGLERLRYGYKGA